MQPLILNVASLTTASQIKLVLLRRDAKLRISMTACKTKVSLR